MHVLTRSGLALVLWCGASATATPLTTCRAAAGWTLEEGPRIPALGRVLRAFEQGGDFALEVSDGRVWTFAQRADAVVVESGPLGALLCEGKLARQPLVALVHATRALGPRKVAGRCGAEGLGASAPLSPDARGAIGSTPAGPATPDGFIAPVTIGAVLGGAAVELRVFADEERLWTLVLTSLEPVTGTFARCFSSAGRHCEPTPAPTLAWAPRPRLTLRDSSEQVTLRCNLEKEELARVLAAQGAAGSRP